MTRETPARKSRRPLRGVPAAIWTRIKRRPFAAFHAVVLLVGVVIGVAVYIREARAEAVKMNWGIVFESRSFAWLQANKHDVQEPGFTYQVSKVILDIQLATNTSDDKIELEALLYWSAVANLSQDPAEKEIAVQALKLFSQGVRIMDPHRFVRMEWGQTFVRGSGRPELELPSSPDPRWPLERYRIR